MFSYDSGHTQTRTPTVWTLRVLDLNDAPQYSLLKASRLRNPLIQTRNSAGWKATQMVIAPTQSAGHIMSSKHIYSLKQKCLNNKNANDVFDLARLIMSSFLF